MADEDFSDGVFLRTLKKMQNSTLLPNPNSQYNASWGVEKESKTSDDDAIMRYKLSKAPYAPPQRKGFYQ